MNKGFYLLVLGLFLGMVSACEPSQKTSEPWIPVLEDTDFSYLRDSVSETLTAVTTASNELRAGQEESAEALEKATIREALSANQWNQSMVARIMHIPLTTLRRKIKKYHITREP